MADPNLTGDNRLKPRPGPGPRLIEGPTIGSRSLYHQQVLDEDSYTDALSHIITRDFFPNLPHIHATNAYLTALTNNDPELLSSSIRRLARIAQEKEDGARGRGRGRASVANQSREDREADEARRAELHNMGTPYISLPGRTPVGARGWDTPMYSRDENGDRVQQRGNDDDDDDGDELSTEIGEIAGPSQPRKKRRKAPPPPRVRDDLSLDAFQRNYTSEDNASFVQIVAHENKQRKEDRWGWAWEAQARAEQRRIEGEERRKAILDAAVGGEWRVDGNGGRLIGGLAEGGRDRAEGEAWREKRAILPASGAGGEGEGQGGGGGQESSGALVRHSSSSTSGALITAKEGRASLGKKYSETLDEVELPDNHPLGRALAEAGLPTTALVSKDDGVLVPLREVTSGSGEGRGRGDEEKQRRNVLERAAMGDEERPNLSLGGSGADEWGFKARNNFYFAADADTNPYPKIQRIRPLDKALAAPPSISHANTRLRDDEEVGPAGIAGSTQGRSSKRGSSPARSWVDAAVRGTPYVPRHERGLDEGDGPMVGDYPLVAPDPSPAPEALPSLLTWGTLLATPRALDGAGQSDDPLDATPSFRLPQTRRRDEIARRLGDKASRSMHERAKGFTPRTAGSSLSETLRAAAERTRKAGAAGGATPAGARAGKMLPPSGAGFGSGSGSGTGTGTGTGSMTPRRSDQLTPAAKRLLDRSMGRTPSTVHGGGAGGGALGLGMGMGMGMGMGSSARGRAASMEKASGWGAASASGGKKGNRATAEMSWTPSPARSRQ